eukprot:6336168-Amphidinium_carterae.1
MSKDEPQHCDGILLTDMPKLRETKAARTAFTQVRGIDSHRKRGLAISPDLTRQDKAARTTLSQIQHTENSKTHKAIKQAVHENHKKAIAKTAKTFQTCETRNKANKANKASESSWRKPLTQAESLTRRTYEYIRRTKQNDMRNAGQ